MCAYWHGLAKLRMHTDHTLNIFDQVTVSIGECLRVFAEKTCSAFDTRELQREADARNRRSSKKTGSTTTASSSTTRRRKKFSLHTYKYHSLGDYPATIRRYGTCDSYSMEAVGLHHFPCKL
jgi:hypothetical protein